MLKYECTSRSKLNTSQYLRNPYYNTVCMIERYSKKKYIELFIRIKYTFTKLTLCCLFIYKYDKGIIVFNSKIIARISSFLLHWRCERIDLYSYLFCLSKMVLFWRQEHHIIKFGIFMRTFNIIYANKLRKMH